jgi:imidazolonepropionase-like amidohydrolase
VAHEARTATERRGTEPAGGAAVEVAGVTGRIDAIVLPSGERRLLHLRDGRLVESGTGPDLAPAGVFVLPGLCDLHTHADFPQEAVPDRVGFARQNLRVFAEAGTLLLRDLGASSRTLHELPRAPGEPAVVPAGECAIGCENHCFPATPSADLVAFAIAQVDAGAAWVKIFTDWPHPSVEVPGKATYFLASNPLTYDRALLARAVAAVHARGARVASHAFTRDGARASLDAGVDSIEHGWGLDVSMLDEMASRGVGWVPLLGIAGPMRKLALGDGRPDQAAWIDACSRSLRELLPRAVAMGVPVLAGTDWFPVVTLADDAAALVAHAVPADAAVAAASASGRTFLGRPALALDEPADLVWYRRDPRQQPGALVAPDGVIAGGTAVAPGKPAIPKAPVRTAH